MSKTVDRSFLDEVRKLQCLACGAPAPSEAHHVKTKGSGGGDDPWNVIPLCKVHHTLGGLGTAWHKGYKDFLINNMHVWNHLKKLGWEFVNKKLSHPNYRGTYVTKS